MWSALVDHYTNIMTHMPKDLITPLISVDSLIILISIVIIALTVAASRLVLEISASVAPIGLSLKQVDERINEILNSSVQDIIKPLIDEKVNALFEQGCCKCDHNFGKRLRAIENIRHAPLEDLSNQLQEQQGLQMQALRREIQKEWQRDMRSLNVRISALDQNLQQSRAHHDVLYRDLRGRFPFLTPRARVRSMYADLRHHNDREVPQVRSQAKSLGFKLNSRENMSSIPSPNFPASEFESQPPTQGASGKTAIPPWDHRSKKSPQISPNPAGGASKKTRASKLSSDQRLKDGPVFSSTSTGELLKEAFVTIPTQTLGSIISPFQTTFPRGRRMLLTDAIAELEKQGPPPYRVPVYSSQSAEGFEIPLDHPHLAEQQDLAAQEESQTVSKPAEPLQTPLGPLPPPEQQAIPPQAEPGPLSQPTEPPQTSLEQTLSGELPLAGQQDVPPQVESPIASQPAERLQPSPDRPLPAAQQVFASQADASTISQSANTLQKTSNRPSPATSHTPAPRRDLHSLSRPVREGWKPPSRELTEERLFGSDRRRQSRLSRLASVAQQASSPQTDPQTTSQIEPQNASQAANPVEITPEHPPSVPQEASLPRAEQSDFPQAQGQETPLQPVRKFQDLLDRAPNTPPLRHTRPESTQCFSIRPQAANSPETPSKSARGIPKPGTVREVCVNVSSASPIHDLAPDAALHASYPVIQKISPKAETIRAEANADISHHDNSMYSLFGSSNGSFAPEEGFNRTSLSIGTPMLEQSHQTHEADDEPAPATIETQSYVVSEVLEHMIPVPSRDSAPPASTSGREPIISPQEDEKPAVDAEEVRNLREWEDQQEMMARREEGIQDQEPREQELQKQEPLKLDLRGRDRRKHQRLKRERRERQQRAQERQQEAEQQQLHGEVQNESEPRHEAPSEKSTQPRHALPKAQGQLYDEKLHRSRSATSSESGTSPKTQDGIFRSGDTTPELMSDPATDNDLSNLVGGLGIQGSPLHAPSDEDFQTMEIDPAGQALSTTSTEIMSDSDEPDSMDLGNNPALQSESFREPSAAQNQLNEEEKALTANKNANNPSAFSTVQRQQDPAFGQPAFELNQGFARYASGINPSSSAQPDNSTNLQQNGRGFARHASNVDSTFNTPTSTMQQSQGDQNSGHTTHSAREGSNRYIARTNATSNSSLSSPFDTSTSIAQQARNINQGPFTPSPRPSMPSNINQGGIQDSQSFYRYASSISSDSDTPSALNFGTRQRDQRFGQNAFDADLNHGMLSNVNTDLIQQGQESVAINNTPGASVFNYNESEMPDVKEQSPRRHNMQGASQSQVQPSVAQGYGHTLSLSHASNPSNDQASHNQQALQPDNVARGISPTPSGFLNMSSILSITDEPRRSPWNLASTQYTGPRLLQVPIRHEPVDVQMGDDNVTSIVTPEGGTITTVTTATGGTLQVQNPPLRAPGTFFSSRNPSSANTHNDRPTLPATGAATGQVFPTMMPPPQRRPGIFLNTRSSAADLPEPLGINKPSVFNPKNMLPEPERPPKFRPTSTINHNVMNTTTATAQTPPTIRQATSARQSSQIPGLGEVDTNEPSIRPDTPRPSAPTTTGQFSTLNFSTLPVLRSSLPNTRHPPNDPSTRRHNMMSAAQDNNPGKLASNFGEEIDYSDSTLEEGEIREDNPSPPENEPADNEDALFEFSDSEIDFSAPPPSHFLQYNLPRLVTAQNPLTTSIEPTPASRPRSPSLVGPENVTVRQRRAVRESFTTFKVAEAVEQAARQMQAQYQASTDEQGARKTNKPKSPIKLPLSPADIQRLHTLSASRNPFAIVTASVQASQAARRQSLHQQLQAQQQTQAQYDQQGQQEDNAYTTLFEEDSWDQQTPQQPQQQPQQPGPQPETNTTTTTPGGGHVLHDPAELAQLWLEGNQAFREAETQGSAILLLESMQRKHAQRLAQRAVQQAMEPRRASDSDADDGGDKEEEKKRRRGRSGEQHEEEETTEDDEEEEEGDGEQFKGPDPLGIIKKKRKRRMKDGLGDKRYAQEMNARENDIRRASGQSGVFSTFKRLREDEAGNRFDISREEGTEEPNKDGGGKDQGERESQGEGREENGGQEEDQGEEQMEQ